MKKNVAVVSGSSSGIGKAITDKLLALNYLVYGISRKEQKSRNPNFFPLACDITDSIKLEQVIKKLLEKQNVDLLVNSAGIGKFQPQEELCATDIKQILDTNLSAPIILTSLLLRSLKKNCGKIINITSIEALKSSKFSATYTASKAGLHHFGLALYEEVRKNGVNVISIHPDMTQTPFFDKLHFKPSQESNMHLKPEDVAQAVEDILNMRQGVSITEVTIRAQYFGIEKKKKG